MRGEILVQVTGEGASSGDVTRALSEGMTRARRGEVQEFEYSGCHVACGIRIGLTELEEAEQERQAGEARKTAAAKEEAERAAREAEEQRQREAEERARQEAEEQARREAEEAARVQAEAAAATAAGSSDGNGLTP